MSRIRILSKILMWLLAGMNIGFLVWVVIDPTPTASFVGIAAINQDAGSELRAMYGGLIGGLGMINLLGVINPNRLEPALWSTAWAFAGVGVVRSLSCLYLGIGGVQMLFAVLELGATLSCFTMLRALETPTQSIKV